MAIIKQQFTITYERSVDTETGEIIGTTIIGSSDVKAEKKKVVKKDNDSEPKVYLLDNKLQLNSLAVETLNVEAGDRIDIQYTNDYPVIGVSETFGSADSGCKLTKSNTLSFRGKKSEALSKYGTEFTLKPLSTPGHFALDNGTLGEIKEDKPSKDESVNTDDIDLDLLIDDADATEVSSSIFQL